MLKELKNSAKKLAQKLFVTNLLNDKKFIWNGFVDHFQNWQKLTFLLTNKSIIQQQQQIW